MRKHAAHFPLTEAARGPTAPSPHPPAPVPDVPQDADAAARPLLPRIRQRAVQGEGAQAKGHGQHRAKQLGSKDAGIARQQRDALQRRQLSQLHLAARGAEYGSRAVDVKFEARRLKIRAGMVWSAAAEAQFEVAWCAACRDTSRCPVPGARAAAQAHPRPFDGLWYRHGAGSFCKALQPRCRW